MTVPTPMPKYLALALCAGALSASVGLANGGTADLGDARVEGNSIVLEDVYATRDGYIVVSEELPDGAPASEPVGFAEVQAGSTPELVVQGDFSYGGRYVIMMYEETGQQEGFQYREAMEDLPVEVNGRPVTTTFEMIVEGG